MPYKLYYEEDKEIYRDGYAQAKVDALSILQESNIVDCFVNTLVYNKVYRSVMKMKGAI